MANTIKPTTGAVVAALSSTDLNGVANGAWSPAGAVVDNTPGGTIAALYGMFELVGVFGAAPTAGKTIDLYAVPSLDGTNYADGSNTVVPQAALYLGSFVLRAVTSQRLAIGGLGQALIAVPPTKFKCLVLNNSGQAFSSGSGVNFLPISQQIV